MRPATPTASSVPRITWYRTPGRSFTRPPRISTIECSCRLWPTPGIYVVTSIPFVRRTRATLRNAEFGFLGVCVYTRMQTPRFSGQPARAGDLVLTITASRPILTSCENVGTVVPLLTLRLLFLLLTALNSFNLLKLRRGCCVHHNLKPGEDTSAKRTIPQLSQFARKKYARERTPLLKGSLRIRIKQELRAPAKRRK